jgi:hypothetical protein
LLGAGVGDWPLTRTRTTGKNEALHC